MNWEVMETQSTVLQKKTCNCTCACGSCNCTQTSSLVGQIARQGGRGAGDAGHNNIVGVAQLDALTGN